MVLKWYWFIKCLFTNRLAKLNQVLVLLRMCRKYAITFLKSFVICMLMWPAIWIFLPLATTTFLM